MASLPFSGSYPITQNFGANPATYAIFGLAGHDGVDFGVPCGTPLTAPVSGTVTSGWDIGGFGNYVTITDSTGDKWLLGHLSHVDVHGGSVVEGQQVGLSGTSGFSIGCHVHVRLRPAGGGTPGYQGAVDPLPFLTGQASAPITLPTTPAPPQTFPHLPWWGWALVGIGALVLLD